MFHCPHCGEASIGWFHKLTSGTWGACECRACGGLSREKRVPRTLVSIAEYGLLLAIFASPLMAQPATIVVAIVLWAATYAVVEAICLYNMPLVPVSRKWEKAKDWMLWAVVAALVGFITLMAAVSIK